MKTLGMMLLCAGLMWGQAGTTNAPQTTKDLLQQTPTQITPPGIDAAVQQLYAVISGPAGKKRDADAFRNMFVKEFGRLSVIGKNPQTGDMGVRILTPDDYISKSFPYLEKNGFFETEVARRMERFGDLLHVWSTYESRHNPGEAPFARGINSIQFANDGSGWKIVSILWEGERPDLKLPEEYLNRH